MNITQIMYLKKHDFFIVKMSGEMRFFLSYGLEEVLNNVVDLNDSKHIIFDLAEADIVDSTILGILVHFVLREENKDHFATFKPIIVCDNMDLVKILNRVGFDTFFNIKKKDERVDASLEHYTCVETTHTAKEDLTNYVKASHHVLETLRPDLDFNQVAKSIKKY